MRNAIKTPERVRFAGEPSVLLRSVFDTPLHGAFQLVEILFWLIGCNREFHSGERKVAR